MSRVACVVPFCRRTTGRVACEWICTDHWRLVDRALKAYRTRRLKRLRLAIERSEAQIEVAQAELRAGGPEDEVWRRCDVSLRLSARYIRVRDLIWRRMKRQAIERAAGI